MVIENSTCSDDSNNFSHLVDRARALLHQFFDGSKKGHLMHVNYLADPLNLDFRCPCLFSFAHFSCTVADAYTKEFQKKDLDDFLTQFNPKTQCNMDVAMVATPGVWWLFVYKLKGSNICLILEDFMLSEVIQITPEEAV